MPLAHPSAAASATSCQVSSCSTALLFLARMPRRLALAQERSDAFLSFVGCANAGDAARGIGDHPRIDTPMRDCADQGLAFELRARTGAEELTQDLVDSGVKVI